MSAIPLLLPGGLSRPQALRWRNGIFAIFGMLGLGIASWMTRVPAIKLTLDISTAGLGMPFFALALGSIVGLAAASHVIAHYGRITSDGPGPYFVQLRDPAHHEAASDVPARLLRGESSRSITWFPHHR